MSEEMCTYELSSTKTPLSEAHNSTSYEKVHFCFECHRVVGSTDEW